MKGNTFNFGADLIGAEKTLILNVCLNNVALPVISKIISVCTGKRGGKRERGEE